MPGIVISPAAGVIGKEESKPDDGCGFWLCLRTAESIAAGAHPSRNAAGTSGSMCQISTGIAGNPAGFRSYGSSGTEECGKLLPLPA